MSEDMEKYGISLDRINIGNKTLSELYSVDNIEEFKKLCRVYFGNISFNDRGYFSLGPFETVFMSDNEFKQSVKAVADKKTDYELDEYTYEVNEYGFRGSWDLLDVTPDSLATFGCSFTFGVGCSVENLWSEILAKKLNVPLFNFGVGGTSIEHSATLFNLVSRFVEFKNVIFLVPSFSRVLFPYSISNKNLNLINFLPNFAYEDPKFEAIRQQVYKVFDDTYMHYKVCSAIEFIISTAKTINANVYFSSWDAHSYKILYESFRNRVNLLPHHRTNIGFFGRDGAHAGKQSNHFMAETYYNILKK